ncbi:MAG: response regulator [bacterium]|nr:response regulator [bacterium]
MKNVLIIEDDSFKSDNLATFLKANIGNANISLASDVASGVSAVERKIFDLIIIDMALPSHPVVSGGGAPMSLLSGGLEILFELRSLDRTDFCIIVTQYPEVEISGNYFPVEKAAAAIKTHFDCDVGACIEYAEASNAWKFELINLIKNI